MFDMVIDIFLVVGVLTPLAAYEHWREFAKSRIRASDQKI